MNSPTTQYLGLRPRTVIDGPSIAPVRVLTEASARARVPHLRAVLIDAQAVGVFKRGDMLALHQLRRDLGRVGVAVLVRPPVDPDVFRTWARTRHATLLPAPTRAQQARTAWQTPADWATWREGATS